MYRCAETAGTLRVPISTSVEGGGATSSGGGARRPPQPITLFSSGHTRAEVAVQLMLTSQDILEGFRLAQEIVTVGCLYMYIAIRYNSCPLSLSPFPRRIAFLHLMFYQKYHVDWQLLIAIVTYVYCWTA